MTENRIPESDPSYGQLSLAFCAASPFHVLSPRTPRYIREIPDHATFREKEHTLGWLDKLEGFLSLALCNLANFDQL